jgi:hypothetical protein
MLVQLSTLLAALVFTAHTHPSRLGGESLSSNVIQRSCGTRPINYTQMFEIERDFKHHLQSSMHHSFIKKVPNVKVYLHIITGENGLGDISDADIAKQIEVLNTDYQDQVSFSLASTDRIENATWFHKVDADNNLGPEMKTKLYKGTKSDLNLYTVGFESSGLLGFASFPFEYKKKPREDGVIVRYSSFPNGAMDNYNLGKTASHEVGVSTFYPLFSNFQ